MLNKLLKLEPEFSKWGYRDQKRTQTYVGAGDVSCLVRDFFAVFEGVWDYPGARKCILKQMEVRDIL